MFSRSLIGLFLLTMKVLRVYSEKEHFLSSAFCAPRKKRRGAGCARRAGSSLGGQDVEQGAGDELRREDA